MLKVFKIIKTLFKIYKEIDGKNLPTTVVVEAASKEAATKIADKISKDDPTVNILVTAVTQAGIGKLEDIISKKKIK